MASLKTAVIRSFLLAFLSLCSSFVFGQALKIEGYCPLLRDGTLVKLVKIMPRRFPSSEIQTTVREHRFAFTITATGIENVRIYVNNRSADLIARLGNVNVLIADTLLKHVTVNGSPETTDLNIIEDLKNKNEVTHLYNKARVDYYQYIETAGHDRNRLDRLSNTVDSLKVSKQLADNSVDLAYVKSHPSSLLNAYLIYGMIGQLSDDSIKTLYEGLSKDQLTNKWGRELSYRVDSLFVGGHAPDLAQQDTSGSMVSSLQFKGKYLLIDFWASWCLPCRAENPTVMAAYTKYHNKGLEILAVSLDKDRAQWVKAIKEDGLPWRQVSDLRAFGNAVSKAFYVYAIPNNYLIAPDGRIIAKNLRGKNLEKQLELIFRDK